MLAESSDHARFCWFNGYLMKPFTLAKLLVALESALATPHGS